MIPCEFIAELPFGGEASMQAMPFGGEVSVQAMPCGAVCSPICSAGTIAFFCIVYGSLPSICTTGSSTCGGVQGMCGGVLEGEKLDLNAAALGCGATGLEHSLWELEGMEGTESSASGECGFVEP